MDTQDNDRVRSQVRTAYAKVAKGADGCSVGCCGTEGAGSLALGYTEEDLASVPEGADLGLGCGNPQAIAALRPGETVLDLGSGAGFDCFLAAQPGRPHGPRHRRRHDAGDGHQGARQRPPGRGHERRVSAGRDRAPARAGRVGRRHHLELRHQPVAGQGRGLPRGDPRAQAGRAHRDLRRRRDADDPEGARRERRGAHRMRGRRRQVDEMRALLAEAGFEASRSSRGRTAGAIIAPVHARRRGLPRLGEDRGAESRVARAAARLHAAPRSGLG